MWELEEPKGPKGRRGSSCAVRKDAGLYCGSRLRSGEVFAYVGRNQNLKDLKKGNLKDRCRVGRMGETVIDASGVPRS